MMKRYRFIFGLAVTAFMVTACEDEQIVNITPSRPAEIGEEIIFGARAGFENANPDTRTVYGDTYEVGGVKYDRIDWVDGSDKIQIMSPEATTPGMSESDAHTAHYVVRDASKADDSDNTTVDQVDEAYLDKITETDPALQWGVGIESDINGDGIAEQGVHTFYAMYPSAMMFYNENGTASLGINQLSQIYMNENEISGYIHTEQSASKIEYDETTKTYTAAPDMRYAYMMAKSVTTRQQGHVDLIFFPLVTAVEITMELPSGNNVKNVTFARVSVYGPNIAGSFKATGLQNWNGTNSFPEGNNITDGSITANSVSIATIPSEDDQFAMTLKPGEKFTFTVFLKPTADLTNLKVGLSLDLVGQNNRYQELQNVNIKARKKNILTGLKLPIITESVNVTYHDWINLLPDDTPMHGISLPGTGHSFSKGIPTSTPNRKYYVSQDLTFDQQWNSGIRAFEIASDRANNTSGTSFNKVTVTCGGKDVNTLNPSGNPTSTTLKIENVFQQILQKLADNPQETAMLILTYQPEGDNPKRNGPQYMLQLSNYLNTSTVGINNSNVNIKDRLIQYSPNLQLGSYEKNANGEDNIAGGSWYMDGNEKKPGARGKLMVVVRPSSADEPDFTNKTGNNNDDRILTGESYTDSENSNKTIYAAIEEQIATDLRSKILVLRGCGTSKDKWGARGYMLTEGTTTIEAPNISNEFFQSKYGNIYIEKYMAHSNNANNSTPIFTSADQTVYTSTGAITIPTFSNNEVNYNNSVSNVTITRPALGTQPTAETGAKIHFDYKTNTDAVCWYQEWARVIGSSRYQTGGLWNSNNWSDYSRIHWFESYQEKHSNATVTFDMAISGNYPNYVFINSLCGYLTDNTTTNTPTESLIPSVFWAYGGAYGNIQALANELNKDFYNHVAATIKQAKAPTGVVIMDFVSNDRENGGGAYWLPQLIINNNEWRVGVEIPDETPDNEEPAPGETPDEEEG